MRSTVDLPQPDGPSNDKKEPSDVLSETSDNAVTVELPRSEREVNVLVSPEMLIPVPRGRVMTGDVKEAVLQPDYRRVRVATCSAREHLHVRSRQRRIVGIPVHRVDAAAGLGRDEPVEVVLPPGTDVLGHLGA